MREERDSLGEMVLADEAYFGIGTARLAMALPAIGPSFPMEIVEGIVQIRAAQAVDFGRSGIWAESIGFAVQKAARRILEKRFPLAPQVQICPLHGGGARGIVANIDEVLANLALEEMGAPKGEYHLVAPVIRNDFGLDSVATYMAAVHIALLYELKRIEEGISAVEQLLRDKEQLWQHNRFLMRMNFRDIAILKLGDIFGQYAEGLLRSRQQLDWLKSRLLPCCQGRVEALLPLREITCLELMVCQKKIDFPLNIDLYACVSTQLKALAIHVLQFCNSMRELLGGSGQLECDRLRAGQPLNPTELELLVPDTVNQAVFSIIGCEAAITAALGAGPAGGAATMSFFTTQLMNSAQMTTYCLAALQEHFLCKLTHCEDVSNKLLENTPLQAERLIPILGYDRAVQVARIATLTEKPVWTVVVKMKLMTAEQANDLFAVTIDITTENIAAENDS